MYDNRIKYIDRLRIFATIGVIAIHTCCQIIDSQVYEMPAVGSFNWAVAVVIDSLARISVPIFLMISGALFIGRDIPLKKLYCKYILRIMIIYVVWSAFYAIAKGVFSPYLLFRSILMGAPRYNFLLYLVGLYMITPLLDKLCESKNVIYYYLVICLLVSSVIPLINMIASQSSIWWIKDINEVIVDRIATMRLYSFMGFTLYYLLGYILHNERNPKMDLWIYVGGAISTTLTIYTTISKSINSGYTVFDFMDYKFINCVLHAMAVFVIFRNKEKKMSDKKMSPIFTEGGYQNVHLEYI